MLKRVDNAVYDAFMDVKNGASAEEWSGVKVLGLAEDGVGYALDEHNEKLITDEMKTAVEEAKAKIVSGEIEVHDYMSDSSCPVS
jgi:basic membrane protein A